jgi:hypothetical protein
LSTAKSLNIFLSPLVIKIVLLQYFMMLPWPKLTNGSQK